ncbi:hypothetical protein CMUS01_15021 [Colletotrichum musicola]|uniref:Uncharacterized protein n=1 Tax=Colletotrichum musicola TaxID=2175873 RepID=A0A8H6J068_9PEZI|nr:hypothetical protein CMUS01_15021 [Colletotrichum musicola]
MASFDFPSPHRNGSPDSNESVPSAGSSILSEDSYVAMLETGLDDQFKEMLNKIRMNENNRQILRERKILSHEAKKRDPNDTWRRTNWSPQMDQEYDDYKVKVETLSKVKKVKKDQARSTGIAKDSRITDLVTRERNRIQALHDDEAWLDAAIDAAKARISFMSTYPDALNTPATKSHIEAINDNLNSAKQAMREIKTQKKKSQNSDSETLRTFMELEATV